MLWIFVPGFLSGGTKTLYDEAVEGSAMTDSLEKGLRAAIVLAIVLVVLAGGCNHERRVPEDTPTVYHEVSLPLIGQHITIRGKFSEVAKGEPLVLLDNRQTVWVGPWKSEDEDLYARMDGKLVEATGTLRFYRDTAPSQKAIIVQRVPDHY